MAGSVKRFVERMRYWCDEGNLGYDQGQRWDIRVGGECDCSSLVIHCLREAGFDTGSASYTGDMASNLLARGWSKVANNGNPQVGDILLNQRNHVAVCTGAGIVSYASIDERGRISGGQSGDQTDRETKTVSYYNYPWDFYLRYTGAQGSGSAPSPSPKPSAGLTVDGLWGSSTTAKLQQVLGTVSDGVVDSQWSGWRAQNPGLTTGWQWVADAKGSPMVRAMQGRLGVEADGLIGPNTIKALQRRMGAGLADGHLDLYSPCVKELQRRLNKGTF